MTMAGDAKAAFDLAGEQARVRAEIDAMLEDALAVPGDERARLFEAMRHAAIGGGKRLRPMLAIASGELFGVPRARALRAGLAVECIHVYSLVHDDLPCMDDDDLRHGKATVHQAYDEAAAVLAGDCLLALAFDVLADPATHPSGEMRAVLVASLARAAGVEGMAGGQMIDLLAPGLDLALADVERLQRLKTGALIGWSVAAGAMLGGAPADAREALDGYAGRLGLAFQIADDLLDAEGEEATAGKRVNKDAEAGKCTFVSLLGAEGARTRAAALVLEAKAALAGFGASADGLRAIADYAVARDR